MYHINVSSGSSHLGQTPQPTGPTVIKALLLGDRYRRRWRLMVNKVVPVQQKRDAIGPIYLEMEIVSARVFVMAAS